MKLYKYFFPERSEFLRTGLIRFAQPGSFNDPYEMQAFIEPEKFERGLSKLYKDDFDEIAKIAFKKLSRGERRKIGFEKYREILKSEESVMANLIHAGSEYMAPRLTETIFQPKFDQILGVLCLTEKPDNLLMWAHYANNHQGFVVEFDVENQFFNQKLHDDDFIRCLQKVNYTQNVPRTSLLDLKNLDFILTKSMDWSYEQEWRMILMLDKCSQRIKAEPLDICLFELPVSCVSKVIMGCRASPDTISTVQGMLREERNKGLIFEKARIKRSQYGIEFDTIG